MQAENAIFNVPASIYVLNNRIILNGKVLFYVGEDQNHWI